MPKIPSVDANLFVLQPCKIRSGWFVPAKDSEDLSLNWRELRAKFAPSGNKAAVLCLRSLRSGGYVGLTRSSPTQPLVAFFYGNANRNGEISPFIIKDDKWVDTVVEVYRVEQAKWASQVTELTTET